MNSQRPEKPTASRGSITTPLSDTAILGWPSFTDRILKRLERGRVDYGDASFTRPLTQLVGEIQQEVDDIVGWSFITHNKLEEIGRKVKKLEEMIAAAESGQAATAVI